MSNIAYTYEIINVDAAARCMEIVYSSPGRQTMHIGARLPFVGESLESVVQMYSPVTFWREQEMAVVVPELGGGELQEPAASPAPEPAPTQPPSTQTTPLQFIDRFTEAEQLGIVTATLGNAAVKLWYDKLLAASFVDIADPRLSAGLDALVSAGLLAPERKVQVLAETLPVSQP